MLPQWRCKELRVVDLGDRGSTVFSMLEPHDQVRVMGMSPCTHTRSGEEAVESKKKTKGESPICRDTIVSPSGRGTESEV